MASSHAMFSAASSAVSPSAPPSSVAHPKVAGISAAAARTISTMSCVLSFATLVTGRGSEQSTSQRSRNQRRSSLTRCAETVTMFQDGLPRSFNSKIRISAATGSSASPSRNCFQARSDHPLAARVAP